MKREDELGFVGPFGDTMPTYGQKIQKRRNFGADMEKHLLTTTVESADLYIRLSIGTLSIGTFETGAPGESEEAVKRRVEPFRQRLERELPIRPDSKRMVRRAYGDKT